MLVIIGLIIGGIMVGSQLVKVSETRSYISEINRVYAAWNTFYTKYDCLPGDCPFATTLFPAQATFNGDGDQRISWSGSGSSEAGQIWREMSWARLYGNPLIATTTHYVTPPGRTGYLYVYEGDLYNAAPIIAGTANYINTGNAHGGGPTYGTHRPDEALAIDSKMDDGMPGSGAVTSAQGAGTTHSCIASSAYNITDIDTSCRMLFKL